MNNFFKQLASEKLTEDEINLLERIARVEQVKTHQLLVDYGDMSTDVYFILTGGFVMKVLKEDGNEKTINFFLDCFQPFMNIPQSYFLEKPSEYNLTAIRNSEVLIFAKEDLLQIIDNNPGVKDFYYKQVITALLSELDFRTKLLTYSPANIYELLVSDYQEIIQNVSARHIANFIGISPEWLSTLKKTM